MQTVVEKRQKLKALEEQAKALRKDIAKEHNKVMRPRRPLWSLVASHLSEMPKKTSDVDTIAETLVAAGHDLGTYPKRSVSVCVNNPVLCGTVFETVRKGKLHTVKLLQLDTYSYNQKRNSALSRPAQAARA